MKTIKQTVFFLMLMCCFLGADAKHIIGGEMFYDLVSSNATSRTFRLTLILFRDEACNSDPTCAQMPISARIGVYNNDNFQLEPVVVDVNLLRIDNVPLLSIPACISNQPNLVYKAGYYVTQVTLPNNIGGFTAAYQTCCRINSIVNIQANGNGDGSTYACVIPGPGQNNFSRNDNSPRYRQGINVVCTDNAFTLDFSATDPDQDSLVYSICSAYNGGAAANANPITPSPPPYGFLSYAPGFNGGRPLGPNATINPRTGIISGVAPASGKYVVAVCVSSFRNGRFLTTHRKDFIISVADCDFASAELEPNYITCDGLTYTFNNLSNSPLNQTYLWNFNDPAAGRDSISTSPRPTHTFSAAGIYTIRMVVNPNTPCADSTTAEIRVFPGYFPDFQSNSPICRGNPVQFNDRTRTNHGIINSWKWDFGVSSNNADTSRIQNPRFNYPDTGTYTATLIVGSDLGCVDTIKQPIRIIDKPTMFVTNDTLICSADDLRLSASTNLTGVTGTYSWSPNYNIINANSSSPTISPDQTTIYFVNYSDNQGCRNRDSVIVRVVDTVSLRAGNDTTICRTDSIQLSLFSDALTYQWTPSQGLNNPNIKNPIASPNVPTTTYSVIANIGSCVSRGRITVKTVAYPQARVSNDTSICFGTDAFPRASGGSIYQWQTTKYLSDPNIANPIIVQPGSGVYQYVVAVRDTFGCPLPVFDSLKLTVIRLIADAGPRDTSIVVNQILQLNATGSTNYSWSPNRWLNNPNIFNPKSKPEADIEYVVTVSNSIGCKDTDSILVKFYNLAAGFYVPNAFSPNKDGLNDLIRPMALGLKSLERFSIFNRWGQLMFTTNQIGAGWDGFFSGQKQEPGTYVWFAEGTVFPAENTNVGVPIKGNGTFILLR